MPTANPFIQAIARHYNATHGLPLPVEGHYVPVNTRVARAIATAFEELPVLDNGMEARHAYFRMAVETLQQFELVKSYINIQPWQLPGQPYANSDEMRADVLNNKHLWFFTGGEVHPLLGEYSGHTVDGIELSFNDIFRAVHDIFGHAAEGYQFGPRGEENAWIHHSMMYSDAAQRALSAETRGQNSWVNFGPNSHLPVVERPYSDQKVALLPIELTDWREALARGTK